MANAWLRRLADVKVLLLSGGTPEPQSHTHQQDTGANGLLLQ
jgi:hypothetical protein